MIEQCSALSGLITYSLLPFELGVDVQDCGVLWRAVAAAAASWIASAPKWESGRCVEKRERFQREQIGWPTPRSPVLSLVPAWMGLIHPGGAYMFVPQ